MRTRKDKREYLKGTNDIFMLIANLSLESKLNFCYLILFKPKKFKNKIRVLVRSTLDRI